MPDADFIADYLVQKFDIRKKEALGYAKRVEAPTDDFLINLENVILTDPDPTAHYKDIISVALSWSFQAPTDPQEALEHAKRASDYEHGVRGLLTDLNTGRITKDEFNEKERVLYVKYHKQK